MVKYKLYVQEMIGRNKEAFNKFHKLHDEYVENPEENQERFNTEGKEIVKLVQEYENRLCGKSERGTYGKFSATLAEKFRAEVRKHFPKIDFVGVTISNPSPAFIVKKISF